MIDQGFCFNAGEWNFPDAPLRGLYSRQRVYDSVRALDSFEPWLARLEQRITLDELDQARQAGSAGMVRRRPGRAVCLAGEARPLPGPRTRAD